ncbi:hypothetical protein [Paraburkholderia bannensis]|uniref:hypothetical protein n=1 Tax=Paraburkholderia bannensis TaxID=765414 RepID=UPI000480CF84|nr:hypothetical protein [Paraburkholderia bannensis]
MSKMLQYENITAKLTSVTPLSEKHGNKRVPAQSLIMEVILPNRRLDVFDDGLRHAFWKIPDGTEPQPTLGMDPDDLEGLTERRFPWFQQDIEIERELAGYTLIIDFGISDDSAIELEAKKIDGFKIGVRDHGLFALRHRFIVHPTTIEKGQIEEMLQQEIKVTLRAPKVPEQGDLLEQPKRGRGRPKKTAAEKIGGSDDPFANSDIAQDGTRIDGAPEGEQQSRDGVHWPFPGQGVEPEGDPADGVEAEEEAE